MRRRGLFLVGAFSSKNARLLQRPFFLQTTELTLIGPIFTETTKTTEAKSGQRKLSAKGPPFNFLNLMLPAKPDETKGSPLIFLAP